MYLITVMKVVLKSIETKETKMGYIYKKWDTERKKELSVCNLKVKIIPFPASLVSLNKPNFVSIATELGGSPDDLNSYHTGDYQGQS